MDQGRVLGMVAAIIAVHTVLAKGHLEKSAQVLQLTTHPYSAASAPIAILPPFPRIDAPLAQFRFRSRNVGLVPPAIVPTLKAPIGVTLPTVSADGLDC